MSVFSKLFKIIMTIKFSNFIKNIFFKSANEKKIFYVDSYIELKKFEESISQELIISIDTEFDWRNTYYPILSLIQVSTKKEIFLIDCIQINNPGLLNELINTQDKLFIFHSVKSDTTTLSSSAGIKITNVFDVQVAEKLISKKIKNYADIVFKYCSIHIDKSETNSNWLKRPLTENQMKYAANDVKYLIEIFKKQKKILKEMNLYGEACAISKREATLGNQKLHISRLKKLKKANYYEKTLFYWREKIASEMNVPPSYIFKNKRSKELIKSVIDHDEKKLLEILKNKKAVKSIILEFK